MCQIMLRRNCCVSREDVPRLALVLSDTGSVPDSVVLTDALTKQWASRHTLPVRTESLQWRSMSGGIARAETFTLSRDVKNRKEVEELRQNISFRLEKPR